MLAYIALIINPNDDESFKRIVNYPARGIGQTTIERIAQLAAARGVSMWRAVEELQQSTDLSAMERTVVRKVADFFGVTVDALISGRTEMPTE